MNKIVVDAFGGDNAPGEIIKGVVNAINKKNGFTVVLSGKSDVIEQELKKYSFDRSRIELLDASDVITNDDVPTTAIKEKKNSSLVVGLNYLKENTDAVGFVSAGSTGAVLAGAIFKVGRIKGVQRPALSPILPTLNDKKVIMLDIGANVDCKVEYLEQFAVMGSSYMKKVYNIESPKVALLSNGTEDKKGNALTKEAFPILKANKNINFVGNMEARDILSGEYDVVVTDGFYGNIALKSTEGAVLMVLSSLKKEIMGSFVAKIGALFLKNTFKKLKSKLDYSKSGGAVLLGIEKIIVKSHGSSKADSICGSVIQAFELHESKFIDNIKEGLVNAKENAEG